MRKIGLFLSLTASLIFFGFQTSQNPYGLYVEGPEVYLKSIKTNPNTTLVDLKKFIPDLVLDIKYATKDNFMGREMYKQARAFARKPVAERLLIIQKKLKEKGLGLKIFDAYRPYSITIAFYNESKDKNFVADPKFGSKHNRGCAIDLTLIDLKTGKELIMPTPYDSFKAAAAADYEPVSAIARKNRTTLIQIMESNGFKVLENEWWHFDFIGWKNYPLMDIPFEKL